MVKTTHQVILPFTTKHAKVKLINGRFEKHLKKRNLSMVYNKRTLDYLKSMEAVYVESKYKIFQIDFKNLKAFVNKQSTYKKRNGKTCHVEHHFGKWIDFNKEDVLFTSSVKKNYSSSFYGLEVSESLIKTKYLTKETKEKIISKYLNKLK